MTTKEDIAIGKEILHKNEVCKRAQNFHGDYVRIRKAVNDLVAGVDGVFMRLNRVQYWDHKSWSDELLTRSFRIKQSGKVVSDYIIYLR